ncbi:hypothetical protein WR25_14701 [Diploscapter pachys]|uniref:SH3 domain-containing protein n=1 Tax=Diploscapter pachys TaxID=2018661 RepID=A0A2A2KNY4_9BILA|nr:hypothetical protein WR25_14701 [Diploscapter pachys]
MKLNLRDRRGSIMYGEDESDKDDSSKSSTSRKDVDAIKNGNGVNGTQKTSPPSKETKIIMEPEINKETEALHAPEPIPVPKARVVKGSRFIVLADLPAEQSGDLAITKGETLIITHTRQFEEKSLN